MGSRPKVSFAVPFTVMLPFESESRSVILNLFLLLAIETPAEGVDLSISNLLVSAVELMFPALS